MSTAVETMTIQKDRAAQMDEFLHTNGLANAKRTPITADASFRRYERLQLAETSLILMDAPPPRENITPFCHITGLLQQEGLSAPTLLARDDTQGFLLLEDFGNDSFSKHLQHLPQDELPLYQTAMDVLVQLYHSTNPNWLTLPPYDEAAYLTELDVFLQFYPAAQACDEDAKHAFREHWRDLLKSLGASATPVLRDYHADNLMWLPERNGLARIGLLDYQDALLGHGVYDVVSLLEDARRDVGEATISRMKQHFIAQTCMEAETFEAAYAILGAQRNLKIVGVFWRLNSLYHKPRYLEYLPRVWRYLEQDLAHPALASIKGWCEQHLN